MVKRQDQPKANHQEEAPDAGEIEQRLSLPGELLAVHGIIEVSTGRLAQWRVARSYSRLLVEGEDFAALELSRVLR